MGIGEAVEPGSTVRTDGLHAYRDLEGYVHHRQVQRQAQGEHLLPRAHRVLSLPKRWLLGTHQGAIAHEHLDDCLDKFTFWFNRQKSASRATLFYRLAQQAVQVEPMNSMNNLLDGRAVAEGIHQDTARRAASLKQRGVNAAVVFVRVGQDPASRAYVAMKEKAAARAGISSQTRVLAETTKENELLELIARLNADSAVHGILVQAPLPRHISETAIYSAVSPAKDVDGFHPLNAGKLILGDDTGFRPCTPAGIHELLIRCGAQIAGAEAVILGRGNIVGKPMAAILMQKKPNAGATVTLCHSQTRDIAAHCRRADILIAALGSPRFVTAGMVKPGAIVIDVGVSRVPDPASKGGWRLVGDVDFENVRAVASRITPNPGGVGPMTIAMLLQNTVRAAEMAAAQL